jgi:serine/threonine protein kinase/ribosomal protein L40E
VDDEQLALMQSARAQQAPVLVHLCSGCGATLSPGATGCRLCGQGAPHQQVSASLAPGTTIARRYRITRPIGSGGMSVLMLAVDLDHAGRHVALRFGLAGYSADTGRRLERERALLAELAHPAIPAVYDVIWQPGFEALVLEHIDGQDLEQGLAQAGRPFPKLQVMRWGVLLCHLLSYLETHQHGPIVHHDLKPANIMRVAASGRLVLVDWDTARAARATGQAEDDTGAYGTVGYAPPEQYRGSSEPRSDVYALAATLYHLATGDDPSTHPFQFPRTGELQAFGWLLHKALSPDPGARPTAARHAKQITAQLDIVGDGPLHAPDGSRLRDGAALASWCVDHWQAACNWLAAGMPGEIELWLGDMQLARQLRQLAPDRRPATSAELHQALLLIDPIGYAASTPRLAFDPPEIDFGPTTGSQLTQSVAVRNTGRQWLQLSPANVAWVSRQPRYSPDSSAWVNIRPHTLDLAPGETSILTLTAVPDHVVTPGASYAVLVLNSNARLPVRIARAPITPPRIPTVAKLLVAMLLWIAISVLSLWATQYVDQAVPNTASPTTAPVSQDLTGL